MTPNQLMRNNTVKAYRSILNNMRVKTHSKHSPQASEHKGLQGIIWTIYIISNIFIILWALSGCACAGEYCPKQMIRINCIPASGYICSDIVKAIGKAENSKRHPYGIMIKTDDPWSVCLRTVKHRMRLFVEEGCPGDFIEYLSRTYAPIGAKNDPKGLNKNWVKNVKFWLKKGDSLGTYRPL